jgi:hypothetical protein
MKILTREEEAQHYRATLFGGTVAGLGGLVVGTLGVISASRRYHFMYIRSPPPQNTLS